MNFILAAFLAALFLLAAVSLLNSLRLLPYKGSAISTDCLVGFIGYRAYHGRPIYTRATEPPYTPAIYTPLTYLSLAALGRTLRPRTFQGFLVEGRILIFAAFLLTAVIAYRWTCRWSPGPLAALAAPLLVLADPTLFRFSAGQRPDVPALLFALLGFSLLTPSAQAQLNSKRIAAAGLLLGIAFLFKQTFIAAPAAAGIWFLWKKHYRWAALLTIAWAVPVAATLSWFQLHGQPVLYGMMIMQHNVYDVPGELRLLAYLVIASPTVVLQVTLGVAGLVALRRRSPQVAQLAGIYLVLAAGMDLTTLAAAGAVRWYLAETTTICSLLAPLGLEGWIRKLRTVGFESRIGAAVLLVGLPAISVVGPLRALKAPLAPWGRLASAVAGHRAFSDNPYVAAQSKDPEAIDPYLMDILQRAGHWSPEPIVAQLKQEVFDFVILRTVPGPQGHFILRKPFRGIPPYSPEILHQVRRSYRMAGMCSGVNAEVFVPREEPRGSQLALHLAKACGWEAERGGSASGSPQSSAGP